MKAHGGGWKLAHALHEITLLDIHDALDRPKVFATGLANDPRSLVEQAVNAALMGTESDAERRVRARLSKVTIGSVARDFYKRLDAKSRRMTACSIRWP